ncbi:MAG: hypothetical protein GY894_04365 [Planctomycetes bacterium]|nr:hypothetical protein [Planctomycetota bacterium]MCP4838580.1 hypothetical protein [Planctomycetota bacterium]
MRVGVCVHAILLTLVGCGSSQSASLEVADGPDAAIAADVDPAGALQWITQQPVWDRAAVGIDSATIDPRILIAVLQPSRATWLVAARSTLRETLELLEAMRSDTRAAGVAYEHVLVVEISADVAPVNAAGCRVIDGGHWQWGGMVQHDEQNLFLMSLLDASDQPVARVTMDSATAANLYREIDRTARVTPPVVVAGTGEEAVLR